MATNRFDNIITNTVTGSEAIDKMIASNERLATSLDGLGQKATKVNEHPGFSAFADKVKQGIQNPLQAAGDMAEGFLTKLGPVGAGVAAAAGAFLLYGKVAMDAARSLGHLGDEVEDTASRMGLTVAEVGKFDFAMKYAGGTMQSLEGIMRKLSQEIDDGGDNLRKMGVNFRDAQTGGVLPMSGIILQLSERLAAMPSVTERNAAAIKVMGRAALEVLPDLLELPKGLQRANELGLGITEAEAKRYNELHRQMAEVDAAWDQMVRKLKEGVTVPIRWLFGSGTTYRDATLNRDQVGFGRTGINSDIIGDQQRAITESLLGRGMAQINGPLLAQNNAAVAGAFGTTNEEKLSAAQERLKDHLKELKTDVLPAVNAETLRKIANDRAEIAGIEAKIKATKDLESAIKSLADLEKRAQGNYRDAFFGDNPFGKLTAQRIGLQGQRDETLRQFAGRPDLQARADAAFGSDFAGLGLKWASDMRKWRDGVMKALENAPIPETERAIKELNDAASATGLLDADGQPSIVGGNLPYLSASAGYISPVQQLRNARQSEQRSISLFGLRSALSGATQGDQIGGLYSLRVDAANREEAALMRIASLKTDIWEREQLELDAKDQRQQRIFEAQLERDAALLELQHRAVESMRSEFGSLFDGMMGGSNGMRQFVTGQARNLGRAAFSNTATSLLTGSKISASSTFGGTWLGDMFSAKGDPSMKLNTAGDRLILAAGAQMEAARAISMSASGGGGGFAGGGSAFSGLFGGGSGDAHPDSYLGGGDWGDGTILPMRNGGFNWGRAAGIAGAGAGAGFGIYSGAQMGGGRGALTAAGSALAGAGAIMALANKALAWAGPAGMIAGMGLGMLTSFLPDRKEQRRKELESERQSRAYTAPSGVDYESDIYGRGYDRDYQGRMRPIVVNINAMDARSFDQWGKENPGAIASVVSNAIMNDEQIPATLNQVMA